MKTIHVAWPVLSKVELDGALLALNEVRHRIVFRGKSDALLIAITNAHKALIEVLELFEEEYGK